VSLGGKPLPADPRGLSGLGGIGVIVDQAGEHELVIQTQNVPTTWTVRVLRAPLAGVVEGYDAVFQSGTQTSATWTAKITTINGVQAVQARAFAP
jgi:hypothetical protein